MPMAESYCEGASSIVERRTAYRIRARITPGFSCVSGCVKMTRLVVVIRLARGNTEPAWRGSLSYTG